jgi:hypothetical protein
MRLYVMTKVQTLDLFAQRPVSLGGDRGALAAK